MSQTNEPSPPDVFLTFCSTIDQASAGRIMAALAIATQKNVKNVHLLFQSCGGTVGDGIALHNYFKAYSLDLSIYNVGSVQSIAAIAYLGAKKRIAHKHATFMVHRTVGPAIGVGAKRLESFRHSVNIDDARTEAILREHSEVTLEQWTNLRDNEFWLTAEDAVKSGVATAIGEFAPPIGAQIYNL
jgi:ATP-dependent Clp protease, protease subunit